MIPVISMNCYYQADSLLLSITIEMRVKLIIKKKKGGHQERWRIVILFIIIYFYPGDRLTDY